MPLVGDQALAAWNGFAGSPLGELTVRWTAGDDRTAVVADDYGPQPELKEEE